jgi:RNA polymerase sigma-70 factor (ECF subfamily)
MLVESPAAPKGFAEDYIMDMSSEEALIEAARGGDRAALERLLEHIQPRVLSFGLKMCGDREDAHEVLQETLLAVARSVRDFRGASSLSTWLYTIARSFCIKRRRRPRPEQPLTEALEQTLAGGRDPEATASGRELERALLDVMAELEPAQREVLVLRDGEGLTAPEVAEVLSISVDAVKSRLHRARVQVRDRLMERLRATPPRGCRDVATLLSRKLEGEISAELCAEMEQHLEGCDACRAQCDSLSQTLALCRRAGSEPVPVEVQSAVRAAVVDVLNR